jgi:hypothetical protein
MTAGHEGSTANSETSCKLSNCNNSKPSTHDSVQVRCHNEQDSGICYITAGINVAASAAVVVVVVVVVVAAVVMVVTVVWDGTQYKNRLYPEGESWVFRNVSAYETTRCLIVENRKSEYSCYSEKRVKKSGDSESGWNVVLPSLLLTFGTNLTAEFSALRASRTLPPR